MCFHIFSQRSFCHFFSKTQVGQDLGIRYGCSAVQDVWTGELSCDEAFLELIQLLGWQEQRKLVRRLVLWGSWGAERYSCFISRHKTNNGMVDGA